MNTLQDVWDWYQSIKDIFHISAQFVTSHITQPHQIPSKGPLQGKSIREVRQIITDSQSELSDFIIVALWSQFESALLDHIDRHRNLIVQSELDPFKRRVLDFRLLKSGYWTFDDTLNLYKSFINPSTVGSIKEIYDYRNWIAHGKKKVQPKIWTPDAAFKLLDNFLNLATTSYP